MVKLYQFLLRTLSVSVETSIYIQHKVGYRWFTENLKQYRSLQDHDELTIALLGSALVLQFHFDLFRWLRLRGKLSEDRSYSCGHIRAKASASAIKCESKKKVILFCFSAFRRSQLCGNLPPTEGTSSVHQRSASISPYVFTPSDTHGLFVNISAPNWTFSKLLEQLLNDAQRRESFKDHLNSLV